MTSHITCKRQYWVHGWIFVFCKQHKVLKLLFLETVYHTSRKHRHLSHEGYHKPRGISTFSLKVTVYSDQKEDGAVLKQVSWHWTRLNGVWENAVLHSLLWHLISQSEPVTWTRQSQQSKSTKHKCPIHHHTVRDEVKVLVNCHTIPHQLFI